MNVSEALASRKSVRAFRPDAVPRAVIEEILTKAARAPSGGNLQPWKVHVLLGAARDELVRRAKERMTENPRGGVPEYHIYPPALTEPYQDAALRGGRADVCDDGHPAGGQGAPADAVRPQLGVLRRTGGTDRLDRPADAAGAVVRSRRLPAVDHAARPRIRPA
ncbi:MAG: nitroreductase family protein [Rhizomicrobium sp.]